MQTGVLRVLRATAASWWRHRELRRTGQLGLAKRLESETVMRDLGHLRQAATLPNAHVICGEGGTFLHLGWTTVSTFAPIERFPLATLAVARGTPFIDIRPVTDVITFANLPRVARDGSVDPDSSGPGKGFVATFNLGRKKPLIAFIYVASSANWAKGQSPDVI